MTGSGIEIYIYEPLLYGTQEFIEIELTQYRYLFIPEMFPAANTFPFGLEIKTILEFCTRFVK